MKLTIPQIGQRVKCVQSDDNGLGGQAIRLSQHKGFVVAVEKLDNGGYSIEVQLSTNNYTDGTPDAQLPKDQYPEAWHWGWDDRNCGELHPNGFDMPALMAFHYHFEYDDNRYNENALQTDDFLPTFD